MNGGQRTIGWIGLGILAAFAAVALASSWIPHDPSHLFRGQYLRPPSRHHLLGTNQIGQDLASQMLEGARYSLLVALMAGAGALVIGTTVGLVAGWCRGWVDTAVMRTVDLLLALPRLPLLLLLGLYVGRDTPSVALVIALLFWPATARAVRSQVLTLRRRNHVRAAIGFGAGSLHIVCRHLVPALAPILTTQFLLASGRAVSLEAGLAFLGVGDPNRMSWGAIMQQARSTPGLFYGPAWFWWMLPPILAIVLVLLGMTFLTVSLDHRFNRQLSRHVPGAA
ncbi:MAG TPA: ABC transporter permease [Acidimicrobiales bacterium]|nr:ABC transporter permease [Acidimicrobiales bacterium]